MKPAEERRTSFMQMRVTDEEKAEIQRMAKEEGMTVSEYCRAALANSDEEYEKARKQVVDSLLKLREVVNENQSKIDDDELQNINKMIDKGLKKYSNEE